MRLSQLLTLCLCFGVFAEAGAQPVNNPGNPGGAAPAAPNSLYEVLDRIEQLQTEVQQLRGVVEEQSQTIADLQRKQKNMYSDLDDRIQALSPAAAVQPQAQAGQPAPVTLGSAQPAPVSLGSGQPAQPAAAVGQPPAAVPPSAVAPAPVTPNPVAAAVKGDEKERYQSAYDTLRNGHNEQAVKMFEALLVDFPNGEFADNAQYWLAEAYKINRETDKAKAAFGKVISKYPNSTKVPDAMLKLGYIEFEQQNIPKAREYLNKVASAYPDSSAAHLATKKLAQMPQ